MRKLILGAAATLVVGACETDRSTVSLTQPSNARAALASISDGAGLCSACTVGPLVFVRKAGAPVTETIHFPAWPVSFVVDIDDLDSQGSAADVTLNGTVLMTGAAQSHVNRLVTLATENTVVVRLTGKPGSQLRLAIWPLNPAVLSVSIVPRSLLLLPHGQAQLQAIVQTVGGAPTTVTWSATGRPVYESPGVTVSAEGLVSAVSGAPSFVFATSTADPSKNDGIPVAVYPFDFASPSISLDVATGPSATRPTSIGLQAELCRPIDAVPSNPFVSVEFSALRNGVRVPIGTGTVSSEEFGGRIRCWHWSMTWTPGDAFGLGVQTLFATGTGLPPDGGTLTTLPNRAVTTVAP